MRNVTTQAERSRAWRERHGEEARQTHARQTREQRQNETAEHREQRLATMYRWRTANPDVYRAGILATSANRRAVLRDVAGRLTAADVLEVWRVQPVCMSCGEGRGLDHIVPMAKGGLNVPSNLQNLCKPCNGAKENASRRVNRPTSAQVRKAAYDRERRLHAAISRRTLP
jgi:5-methylcytosine-specific restriction endonuclease McrA